MFDKLKEAFNSFAKAIVEKELSEKDIDRHLWELELKLISSDVASPVAKNITEELKRELLGARIKRFTDTKKFLQDNLVGIIKRLFPNNEAGLIEIIKKRRKANLEGIKEGLKWHPFVVLFLGPNGSGKTTTIAKMAWKLKQEKLLPLLVAADTFRAGAIEQLEKHSKKIGVPIIKRKYGVDPASVAFDAVSHASARKMDAVLIDTAGRLGSDVDLLQEMKKIARVIKPDYKILVVDALSGNDIAYQAERFAREVGVDGNIITKLDADVKGGAALTLVYVTNAPIIYAGVGQKYDDLILFNLDWFIDKIFS